MRIHGNAPILIHVKPAWPAMLHLIAGHTGRTPEVPPGPARPNGSTMNQSEFRNQHEREAARLRSLLATATTPALKSRLLKEIEEREQLAEGLEDRCCLQLRSDIKNSRPTLAARTGRYGV
jgi:hypothetical protein